MYRPTELRQFLESLGAKAKKSLSQNFLVDGNILRKIVQEAQVEAEDLILEIGPGPGALTQILLEKKAKVIAVEKDNIFAEHLKRLGSDDQLEVFCEDILNFPIEVVQQRLKPFQKAKIVANLPYQLTTPILNRFITHHAIFSNLTIMVQKEVAQRMTAKVGSADYSSLTVFVHLYSNPRYGFTVSNSCFYPVPKVQSAIVSLDLKKPPDIDLEAFSHLVRTAFQQRRKMVKTSLKELYSEDEIIEGLKIANVSLEARPENLSLEQFLSLFRFLTRLKH